MGRDLRLAVIVGTIAVLLGLIVTRRTNVAGGQGGDETPIQTFASMAATVVVPTYPPMSLQSGTSGVAVARVAVDVSGRVRRVDVLEAPDPAIADSVRTALLRWVFPSRFPNGRSDIRGRVVVYFVIDDGRGLVLTPQEMAARRAGKIASAEAWGDGLAPLKPGACLHGIQERGFQDRGLGGRSDAAAWERGLTPPKPVTWIQAARGGASFHSIPTEPVEL